MCQSDFCSIASSVFQLSQLEEERMHHEEQRWTSEASVQNLKQQEKEMRQKLDAIQEREHHVSNREATSSLVHEEVSAMMESLNRSVQQLASDRALLEQQKAEFKKEVQVCIACCRSGI